MTRKSDGAGKASYDVGRGKPPVHSRFKPGQSGNPKGRPRGSVDLQATFVAEARQTVAVTENGRQVRLSKYQVLVRQLLNRAASGDHRATDLALKHLGPVLAAEVAAKATTEPSASHFGDEDDEQAFAVYAKRYSEGLP